MCLFRASGGSFDPAETHDAVVLIRGLGSTQDSRSTPVALFSHFNTHNAANKWFPALVLVVLIAATYALYTATIDPFRLREPASM